MSDITYALRIAREGGGTVIHRPHKPRVHKFHVGPIHSSVAGRTDHLPITVESGSYVIPADIISAFGEGNTIAGFKHARRVFGGMPRGQGQQPYNHEGGPYGGGAGPYGQNGKIPYGMARGGYADGGASTKPAAESEPEPAETRPAYYPAPETAGPSPAPGVLPPSKSDIKPTDNPARLLVTGNGGGNVRGLVVPRHMWEGGKGPNDRTIVGMRDRNAARAAVYGAENRPPLTKHQITMLHKAALQEHFAKPLDEQIAAENAATEKLRAAMHLGPKTDTLDGGEKLATVEHELDSEGRSYQGFASKGIAGHALYTSGVGDNTQFHILNTCAGQTKGCSGGLDKNGVADTSQGICFAPNAEAQYADASVRRSCHAQAKHDPAMSRDWILAHTGSLRNAAARGDKHNLVTLFRPNVVDESDTTSRYVIKGLNKQRVALGLPKIVGNSYGKTTEMHDPENSWFVTYSNGGPKVKKGRSIKENIQRDPGRVQQTITATNKHGHIVNDEGHQTPPKNSYVVTDVKRYSKLDQEMQKHLKYVKYWSRPRGGPLDVGWNGPQGLSEQEKAEGPEAHYDGNGNLTTPDKAHYGHITLNGSRYDYQKQHILHPRPVPVGFYKDGRVKTVPTDSRFKDDEFLPRARYKSRNGKKAGAIILTTPTTSTSAIKRQAEFTHHINFTHIEHAKANRGELEIDPPAEQEAARDKPYVAPKSPKDKPRRAYGGGVFDENHEPWGYPEQSFATQQHYAHRHDPDDADEDHNYADGGDAHDHEKGSVPIVAAGGEYVLSPSQVRSVGNGDLDTGHRVLDKFVKDTRAQLIKTLKKLPGPAKD